MDNATAFPIRRMVTKEFKQRRFERRTSTGSGIFALLSRDFQETFRQIVSIRVKILMALEVQSIFIYHNAGLI